MATRASSGTTARSCSSKMAKAFCPWGVCTSPFSSSICITRAVDERASPSPAISEPCQLRPTISRG